MKKIIIIIIALMAIFVATMFYGSEMEGAGDENYHGEDGEQPATGAEESPGDGLPENDQAADTGDRTRNKDS